MKTFYYKKMGEKEREERRKTVRERVGKKKETRPSGSDSSSPLMKTLAKHCNNNLEPFILASLKSTLMSSLPFFSLLPPFLL